MAIVASVTDGSITSTTTTGSSTVSSTDSSNSYDMEMFLTLLVAEMQYQDPLEPTTNTEYVTQLASFTQIEAMEEIQDQVASMEANSLAGKYVILCTDDSTYVSGKVDYVMDDGSGNKYLSVNDALYSIDTLDTVCDEEYYIAVVTAQEFNELVSSLPDSSAVTLQDEEDITYARTVLDSLTSYQLQFIYSDDVETLEGLEEALAALIAAAEETTETDEATEEEAAEEATEETEVAEEA